MVRGNARAARAIATASPDSSLPLGDRERLGRPGHALFSVSFSAGAKGTKSVDTRKYALPLNQSITRLG
jgi:hypothetical protein